jgi:hypothetical protein
MRGRRAWLQDAKIGQTGPFKQPIKDGKLPTYSKNNDLNGQIYGRWAGLPKLPNRERRSVFMDISIRDIGLKWLGSALLGKTEILRIYVRLSHFPAAGDGISILTGAGLICTVGAFVALPCRTRLAA